MRHRARRPAATGVMVSALLLTLACAWALSAWFLVPAPFLVGGAYAMWLGLSNDEALDAFGTWNDSGSGPAGMAP